MRNDKAQRRVSENDSDQNPMINLNYTFHFYYLMPFVMTLFIDNTMSYESL